MVQQRGSFPEQPERSGCEAAHSAFAASLAELFRSYNTILVGYLAVRLNSQAEAAEVSQEAYLRLLNMADSSKIVDLKSFLFRTANNIAIDRIRHQQARLRALEQVGAAIAGDGAVEAGNPGPEREIDARQTIGLLRAAIEELPPKCRMAFILYKLQGQGYAEIAAHMQLTESMVRKYVLRGLQYCRQRLGEQWGP